MAGLDTQVECAQSGTPDHISRIQCQQTYYDVSCQVDGIDVTKGFSANPLIPIPYYQNKQTLEIDFPDNSFYVPGSGNIIDVEGCTIRQYMIICPQVSQIGHIRPVYPIPPTDCLEVYHLLIALDLHVF